MPARSILPIALLVCAAPSLVAVAPVDGAADDEPTSVDEVLLARSLDPDSAEALERLSLRASESDDVDGAVAYLLLAIDAYERAVFASEDAKKKKLDGLARRLKKLDGGLGSLKSSRNKYLRDLTWALKLYTNNQGKLRNALEVGERVLSYRPDHPIATGVVDDLLEQLDADARADAERLLWQKELKRSRSFLADWAAEHRSWSDAGQFESRRFVVSTNAGYDVGQVAVRSLESISDYFEDFYGGDVSRQKGRTKVLLCRTHDEFERVANDPITQNPGLLAFIRTGYTQRGSDLELEFTVYGYDPRDQGRPLSTLWPTLWHEASHQYMAFVSGARPAPLWLNEGMSSYFEGATFSDRGEIRVGLPAAARFGHLYALLERDEPLLWDLVTAEGMLTGDQYALAWGVVYYLVHGRGEDGVLLRPMAVRDALQRVEGGLISGPGLFEGAVLDGGEVDLEDFEAEWRDAMLAMYEAEQDPVTRAGELVAIADVRRAAGATRDARRLLGEALLRDPDCIPALSANASMEHERWLASKRKSEAAADATLLWARRLMDAARAAGDEAVIDEALDLCTAVDKAGIKKIWKAEKRYRDKLDRLLAKLVEEGRPKTALAVAELYVDDVLGDLRSDALARELRAAGVLALERPYRPFDGETLMGLAGARSVFRVEDGAIVGRAPRPAEASLLVERSLTPLFRLEGSFTLSNPNTMFGLTCASPEVGLMEGFVLRPAAKKGVELPGQMYKPFDLLPHGNLSALTQGYNAVRMGIAFRLDGDAGPMKALIVAGKEHAFVLSRTVPGELVLEIDGVVVGRRSVEEEASASSLGLVLYGGEARIEGLRAVEFDRL